MIASFALRARGRNKSAGAERPKCGGHPSPVRAAAHIGPKPAPATMYLDATPLPPRPQEKCGNPRTGRKELTDPSPVLNPLHTSLELRIGADCATRSQSCEAS